jgi:hypothetical protein
MKKQQPPQDAEAAGDAENQQLRRNQTFYFFSRLPNPKGSGL